MTKQERIDDMQQMYDALTKPEIIKKNIQIAEKKKRMEDKKKDTGL